MPNALTGKDAMQWTYALDEEIRRIVQRKVWDILPESRDTEKILSN